MKEKSKVAYRFIKDFLNFIIYKKQQQNIVYIYSLVSLGLLIYAIKQELNYLFAWGLIAQSVIMFLSLTFKKEVEKELPNIIEHGINFFERK